MDSSKYNQAFADLSYKITPPRSLQQLQQRLQEIMTLSLNDLATTMGLKLPSDTTATKGYAGMILERYLGADAGNQAQCDFTHLGIELKTIQVDEHLKPLESLFITKANLLHDTGKDFYDTSLYLKLRHMLIVLTLSAKGLPIAKRIIVGYFFFKPSAQMLDLIKADYDELMNMVCEGRANDINARIGEIIQMRPKAASGSELTEYIDSDGRMQTTRPRGFYLRRSFIADLIAQQAKPKR